MAADAAMDLGRIFKAEREACRTMHKHLLRAQAEVLKGLLAVVESRLATKEPGNTPPANEKIPVD
jgi:hypothetical protein